jgi:hypothetical protein
MARGGVFRIEITFEVPETSAIWLLGVLPGDEELHKVFRLCRNALIKGVALAWEDKEKEIRFPLMEPRGRTKVRAEAAKNEVSVSAVSTLPSKVALWEWNP